MKRHFSGVAVRALSLMALGACGSPVWAQTAPPNDNWANAIAIPSVAPPAAAYANTQANVNLATSDATDPQITCKTQNYNAAQGQMANSVWYTYTTGAATEYVNIKATEASFTNGNFDAVVAVWTGAPSSGFHMVSGGCNDEGVPYSSPVDFARIAGLRLQPNTTYSIEVAFNPNTAASIPATSVLRLDVQAATQITVDTNADPVPVSFSGWSAPPAMTGNPCLHPTTPGTCSLRTAIETAAILVEPTPNAAGANGAAILVPAGTYTLTAYNNGNAGQVTTDPQKTLNVGGGDLDIWESMGIYGAGMGQTILVAPPNDRVFNEPVAFFNATTAPPGIVASPNWLRAARVNTILSDMTLQGPGPNVTPAPTGPSSAGLFSAGGALNAFERVEFTGGFALGNGGAINGGNALQIRDCRFTNNTAVYLNTNTTGAGGAINHQQTNDFSFIEISGSTFTGNSAASQASSGLLSGGGAILAEGELSLVDSTFTGNSTKGYGGAILITRLGGGEPIADIRSSTIADNVADSDGDGIGFGGGIYIDAASSLNSSTPPLPPLPTAHTVVNSIIANNSVNGNATSAGANCAATPYAVGASQVVIDTSYSLTNVAGTGPCAFSGTGNIVGLDPMLAALADNGGPTQTQALQPGSPAVDAGDPAGCTDGFGNALAFDQRGSGFGRVSGARCDMGAFELTGVANAPGAPVLSPASDSGDSNSDGITNVVKPTFTGTCGTDGDSVSLFENGAALGSGACSGGTYSVTLTTALTAGVHAIAAFESNAGGPSPQSAATSITILLSGPTIAFTSTPPAWEDGSAGFDEFVFTVSDNRLPTAKCTMDGAAVAGDGCDTGDATYSSLAPGQHTFAVSATDIAGNVTTKTYIWQIGTPTATVPTLTSDTGSSSSDGITNADPLVFADACTAGDSIQLYDGGSAIGSPAVCAGTSVSISIAGVAEGTHTIAVVATRAGHASAPSGAITVLVDRTPPFLTMDSTPQANMVSTSATFAFHDDDGSPTQCQLDAGAPAACASPATYTGLALGSHTVTIASTDVAGNVATPLTYTWSVIQPSASGAPMLSPASDTGRLDSDGITHAIDTVFTGACTDGDSIQLYDGGNAVGTAAICASGVYNIALSNLPEGTHSVAMTATRNGITSALSAAAAIVIDRTPPNAPAIGGNTGAAGLTAMPYGLAEPNAIVQVFDGVEPVCAATADMNANWSCNGPLAGSGSRSLTATATDVAGNTSAASPVYDATTSGNDRIFRDGFGD